MRTVMRRIVGPEVLTRGEVAQLLGVHPSTVARWAAAGLLLYFRTPAGERRYRRSEIQDFLNQPPRPPSPPEHPARAVRAGRTDVPRSNKS
jgi:excisionase family DNA binding protein